MKRDKLEAYYPEVTDYMVRNFESPEFIEVQRQCSPNQVEEVSYSLISYFSTQHEQELQNFIPPGSPKRTGKKLFAVFGNRREKPVEISSEQKSIKSKWEYRIQPLTRSQRLIQELDAAEDGKEVYLGVVACRESIVGAFTTELEQTNLPRRISKKARIY